MCPQHDSVLYTFRDGGRDTSLRGGSSRSARQDRQAEGWDRLPHGVCGNARTAVGPNSGTF